MRVESRPMLLCLDLEEGSESLAREAAGYCLRCNQPLHLLHVIPRGRVGQEERARERLRHLVDEVLAGVDVRAVAVREGIAEDVIVAYAREEGTAPILLGRRFHTRERIYVGSTTSAVISMAEVPVMVIPLEGRRRRP